MDMKKVIILFVLYVKKPNTEQVVETPKTEVDTALDAIFADEEMIEAELDRVIVT